jgi:hypothetical protein
MDTEESSDSCLDVRHNDPSVTELLASTDSPLLCSNLGDALLGNTHVSSLTFQITNSGFILAQMSSLLSFVRHSQSLRKVRFTFSNAAAHVPACMEALLQNPWITDLYINTIDTVPGAIPPIEIGPIIHSKPNLKVLNVTVEETDHSASEALSTNKTIETLRLDFCRNTSQEAGLIFRTIANHPRITCLDLCFWRDKTMACCDGLCFLLATTTVLVHLIVDFPIDVHSAERLVEALHANQTLTTLHIPVYFLEEPGVESVLVPYMRTRNGVGTSRIRTLIVASMHAYSRPWHSVAQILEGPYGSGLDSIKLDWSRGPGLWAHLAKYEQSSNLRSLEVTLQGDEDFAAMLEHLPTMETAFLLAPVDTRS